MLDQSYYSKTDEIIEHYGKDARSLIPIMQDIQAEYRYLPGELLIYLFRYSEGDTSIHFAKALRKALVELNPASSAISSMVIRESVSRRRRLSSTLNRFT